MLQINFRHMSSTDSLRTLAEEKFAKLEMHAAGPFRCHLVVDHRAGHARRGAAFTAHAELRTGRGDLRIDATATHEYAAGAVREVFAHLMRQLDAKLQQSEEEEPTVVSVRVG